MARKQRWFKNFDDEVVDKTFKLDGRQNTQITQQDLAITKLFTENDFQSDRFCELIDNNRNQRVTIFSSYLSRQNPLSFLQKIVIEDENGS